MKKFVVTIKASIEKQIPVEAHHEGEAAAEAQRKFLEEFPGAAIDSKISADEVPAKKAE